MTQNITDRWWGVDKNSINGRDVHCWSVWTVELPLRTQHVWKAWNWLTWSRADCANLPRSRCPVVCRRSTCLQSPAHRQLDERTASDLTTALRVALSVAIRHPRPVQSTRRARGSIRADSAWRRAGQMTRLTYDRRSASRCSVLIAWPRRRRPERLTAIYLLLTAPIISPNSTRATFNDTGHWACVSLCFRTYFSAMFLSDECWWR